jgi:enamine deaminase RidA (YjgF/YER057c/UK114 family)
MDRRNVSSGSEFEQQIAYSRAVVCGDMAFVSGTTGFDYATMTISDSAEAQARQALDNIEAALASAGFTFADIVKVTYILPEPVDFESCWPVLREKFGQVRPAATMISARLMDRRMKIEIEAVAVRKATRT